MEVTVICSLKANIFLPAFFLKATTATDPSLGWRSVLMGREALNEGLRWCNIATGCLVDCMDDPYLLCKPLFRPISSRPLPRTLRWVHGLIDWNVRCRNESFFSSCQACMTFLFWWEILGDSRVVISAMKKKRCFNLSDLHLVLLELGVIVLFLVPKERVIRLFMHNAFIGFHSCDNVEVARRSWCKVKHIANIFYKLKLMCVKLFKY
jgi:hypothetical protein